MLDNLLDYIPDGVFTVAFLVNQDGVVYQRNLGENTAAIASARKEYNPDSQWTVVREKGITDLMAKEPGESPQ